MFDLQQNAGFIFSTILETATSGIFLADFESGAIGSVNPAIEKITGYLASELHGRKLNLFLNELMDSSAANKLLDALKKKERYDSEVICYKKDGIVFWNSISVSAVCDSSGNVVCSLIVFRDISASKLVHELKCDLDDTTTMLLQYKKAIDMVAIVSKTDLKGIITFANERFCQISGYDKAELIGRPHNLVRHPDMPAAAFKDMWETIQSKQIWNGIVQNKTKDGGNYYVDATVFPIQNAAGEIIEYMSVRNDITQIILAQKAAEDALKQRSQFFANVSHELRTPLNSIINFTDNVLEDFEEMFEDEETKETNKDFLNRVLKNSKYLLNLINDILDVSKLEAGRMHFYPTRFDACDVLEDAYRASVSLFTHKTVEFRIKKNSCVHILIDRQRFVQILLNLISNSAKATSRGFVELRCRQEDGFAIVEVEDSGKGIPQDKLELIFQPFEQVDEKDTGSGLGLKIVKDMCEAMGIAIGLKSQVGMGTTFMLKIKVDK